MRMAPLDYLGTERKVVAEGPGAGRVVGEE